MNISLLKDKDKEKLLKYEELIQRCIVNKELAPDTLTMQNELRSIIIYYGLQLGCLCNAKGWLKSLSYVNEIIKELHKEEENNKDNIIIEENEKPKSKKRSRTKKENGK